MPPRPTIPRPTGPRPARKTPAGRPAPPSRAGYHHGNLRASLIDATLRLIEESGPEGVTVREAAKRAGVSSGAPFRHFPTRTALMTAVAEEAMHRFRAEIVSAMAKSPIDDPLVRFRALGDAYFRWVTCNPTHFLIISDRRLIDFAGSESLVRDNAEIQAMMERLLVEARDRGLLRVDDLTHVPLAARAIAYGVARMYIDGHLPQWGVRQADSVRAMRAVLDLFMDGLAADERTRG
jgi:AcrR family transcriptional regulator